MEMTYLSIMSYEKRKTCLFFVKAIFLKYDWLIAVHLIGGEASAENFFIQKNVRFLFLSTCNGGIIELSIMYSVNLG